MRTASFLALALISATAASAQAAVKVLLNGAVYTMNPDRPTAEAIAIDGDRITFVGDSKGAMRLVSDQTQVIDLDGKLVLLWLPPVMQEISDLAGE